MGAMTAKTGLSVLVMLLGWFQDGLTRLDTKDYQGAVLAFSTVISHPQVGADLRRRALVFRSIAYQKKGERDKAMRDLAQVMDGARDPEVRQDVFATLARHGGDIKTFLPREVPRTAFGRAKRKGLEKDLAGFCPCLTGDLAAMMGAAPRVTAALGDNDGIARGISQLCGDVAYLWCAIGEGKEAGTAEAILAADKGRLLLRFRLLAVGDQWRFDALLEAKRKGAWEQEEKYLMTVGLEDARRIAGHPEAAEAMARLDARISGLGINKTREAEAAAAHAARRPSGKAAIAREVACQKQLCLKLYSSAVWRGGAYPKSLDKLGGGGDTGFKDPASGRDLPRLYRCLGKLEDVTNPHKKLVLAAPGVISGQRIVGFADGHVEEMLEADFLKAAMAQGWQLAARAGEAVKQPKPARRVLTPTPKVIVPAGLATLSGPETAKKWDTVARKRHTKELQIREMGLQKEVSTALFKYADAHGGVFPKELKEIAPLLGEEAHALEFIDPTTGRKSSRLYRCLGNVAAMEAPGATYNLATPTAIGGARVVSFGDGHGELVDEAEFLTKAEAQGWDLDPWKPEMSEGELKARVNALVVRLGDRKSSVRKAAYRELKKLGDRAKPLLAPHRKHPDPEIRMSIRDILKKKAEPVPGRVAAPGGMGGLPMIIIDD